MNARGFAHAATSEPFIRTRLTKKFTPRLHLHNSGGEARGRRGLGQKEMAMNYRTRFAYRIDAWDANGEKVIEHLAGVEDLQVAKATYLAACQRWPGTPITLRQGTRVIEDSRRTRLV
jgi:hypothetical protein